MPATLLLVDALEAAVASSESAVAIAHGRRTITYGELDAYANALAFALECRGVAAGDRVATLLDGAEALIAFWAIAKTGAVGVAFGVGDVEELAAALREVDARAFIVDAAIAPTFHHAVARAPQLRAVIARGRDVEADAGSASYVSYDTALADEDPMSRRPSPRRIDLDDAWLVQDGDDNRTSLSHRVLLARGGSLVRGLSIASVDCASGTAFTEVAVACVLAGASFRIAGDEPREGGRSLWICADDDDASPPTGSTSITLYAPITTGPVAVVGAQNEPAHLLPNVDVRVVDDSGARVAAKVVGEIAVRSSSLTADAARQANAEGFFRTGDSGMLDDSGALYIL